MEHTKNVFITNDIVRDDERMIAESEQGFEGFELTEDFANFLEFVVDYSKTATEDEKKTAQSFADTFPQSLHDIKEWIDHEPSNQGGHSGIYEEWCDTASHEERYSVPMMNCLRYFPDFVSFEEQDRYSVAGNTCLIYDRERDAWAVGMTGGGMDLAPHLLDTFIRLGKGVPLELAEQVRANYSANMSNEEHAKNCELLAQAFLSLGVRNMRQACELSKTIDSDDTIKRHLKALEKKA